MIGLRFRLLRNVLRWRRRGRRSAEPGAAVAGRRWSPRSPTSACSRRPSARRRRDRPRRAGGRWRWSSARSCSAARGQGREQRRRARRLARERVPARRGPSSLPSLVVARSLARRGARSAGRAVPVPGAGRGGAHLAASAPAPWLLAAVTSVLVQVGISALAQAMQIAVVRYAPPRGRRTVWIALRLGAALTLARRSG